MWDSRPAGFLVAWAGTGGYVALLALVAAWAGRLVGPAVGADPPIVALVALGVVLLVHLHPRVAGALTLGVDPAALVAVGYPLAALTGLVALPWAPSRLLRGTGELLPPLARTNRFGAPDAALVVVVGAAAAVVAADAVGYALYLVPAAPALGYAVHGLSVAALPFARPRLHAACDPRPSAVALVVVGGTGAAGAGGLWWLALTLDPVSALRYTLHRPAVTVVRESVLLVPPLRSAVPALVGWLVLGALVYVAARDYRAERGVEPEPTRAAYVSGEGARRPGAGDGRPGDPGVEAEVGGRDGCEGPGDPGRVDGRGEGDGSGADDPDASDGPDGPDVVEGSGRPGRSGGPDGG